MKTQLKRKMYAVFYNIFRDRLLFIIMDNLNIYLRANNCLEYHY